MKFDKENKEEIFKRLIDLEKKVSSIDKKLNSGTNKESPHDKKYEMNLTHGNRNFLKIISIVILAFFIIYWIYRIFINN